MLPVVDQITAPTWSLRATPVASADYVVRTAHDDEHESFEKMDP